MTCTGPECTRPAVRPKSGLCETHYQQLKVLGRLQPIRAWGQALIRDEAGNKKCPRCKDWKPESDFYVSKKSKDGFSSPCKSCESHRHLFDAYGISPEQYADLMRGHEGACAICLKQVSLMVDHDHETGQVRGLLCRKCNLALGYLEDNMERINRAFTYLERSAV